MVGHKARQRDFVALEARRRQAVAWIQEGRRKTDVARRLGVSFQAVWGWWRAYQRAGFAGLARRKRPGPAPKLTDPEIGRRHRREAALRNLAKAKASPRWHPPRPWRSAEETRVIKRLVWQWFNYAGPGKWSGCALARRLGVHHTYVNRLRREFGADPGRALRQAAGYGGADFQQLRRAQERTKQMRERGQLQPPRFWKVVKLRLGDRVEKVVVRSQPKKFAEEFLPLPANPAWASPNRASPPPARFGPAGPPRRRRGVCRPTFWRWRQN